MLSRTTFCAVIVCNCIGHIEGRYKWEKLVVNWESINHQSPVGLTFLSVSLVILCSPSCSHTALYSRRLASMDSSPLAAITTYLTLSLPPCISGNITLSSSSRSMMTLASPGSQPFLVGSLDPGHKSINCLFITFSSIISCVPFISYQWKKIFF